MDKGKGKTFKRKSDKTSEPHFTANKQVEKKLRLAKSKEVFHEVHGDSYNVHIFRTNMNALSQEDVAAIKTELTVYF